ncbi:hypothetical protein C0Q70_08277 [Pomacea canaliculata]|uniref:Uncharacterized protein n=1 Tax=Pomacea canaliculata TaxID=400727 RepID=A0A2T7PHG1_POMCA|nr:hypothetical protein C0Q70_08277 [Pomacea canaliculata]
MGRTWTTLVLTCLAVVVVAADPTFEVSPGGLKVRIPDGGGYTLIGFHFSVNKPLPGVAAGDYAVDMTTKTGNEFVYTWPEVVLKPGDTVNYWYLYLQNGLGHNVLGKSWTYDCNHVIHKRSCRRLSSRPGDDYNHSQTNHPRYNDSHRPCPDDTEGPGEGDGFVDSSQCTSFPCLIFEDNFDFINHRVWQHEITAGGGGNWEFQYYTNNRTNSYTKDGVLYIKPATIWMLPTQNVYGNWPASGEIDIMESRGNRNYHNQQGVSVGVDSVGSTLHFGADYFTNQWPKAHAEKFYVDDEEILRVDPGPDGFWKFSGLDETTYDNPWREGSRMAPFDQEVRMLTG